MGIFDRLTIESKFAKWKFPLKVIFFFTWDVSSRAKVAFTHQHTMRENLLVDWRENLGMEVFHPGQLSTFNPSHGPMLSNHVYLNWLAHDKFTIVRNSGKATGLPLICIHDFISEYDVVIMILIHWTGYLWIDFEPLQNEIV